MKNTDLYPEYIFKQERAVKTGEYIVEHQCTVREAAKELGISKSTVHKDVTEKLFHYDVELFEEVNAVLKKNKAERHLRGGMATRDKYLAIKSCRIKMKNI